MSNRAMKDSGIEWIGEIPKDWSLNRLKHYIKYTKGKNPQKLNNDGIGLPYIGASDLESKTSNYLNYTTDLLPICEEDNVLVLWDGARAGLIGFNHKGVIASTVVSLTVVKNDLNSYFLFYLLKGFQNHLIALTNGTTIPHMNRDFINELGLPLPPLHEQQAIATYLDEQVSRLDRLIEDQQQDIEDWKSYKQSIITEAVTKGLNPEVEMEDSGIEWIGEIPSHWNITNLSKVATFYNGDRSSKYPKDSDYVTNGIPFLNAGDLFNGVISLDKSKFISKEKYQELGGAKLKFNDILYCLRGSLGKIGYNDFLSEGSLASSLILIRSSISPRYTYYILSSEVELEQRKMLENGTAQPNLSAKVVGSYTITLPPLHEQQQIAEFLDEKCSKIDRLIEDKQHLIEDLKDYKQSLIYECVTGKKEIV